MEQTEAVVEEKSIEIAGPGPSFPVVVFSAEVVKKSKAMLRKAKNGVPSSYAEADKAGLLLNEIQKFRTEIEDNRKKAKEPFLEFGKKIDAEAKKALDVLDAAIVELKNGLKKVRDEEDKRLADERRKAEEEKAKAEKDRREAEERAKAATNEEEKAKAAKEAEAAKAKAQAVVVPSAAAPAPIAGTKNKKVPVFSVLDMGKCPSKFKIVDEKALKKEIEEKGWGDKTPAPAWLSVKWETDFSAKGK